MRKVVTSLCLTCIFAAGTTHAQERKGRGKDQYVPVPREVVLPVVVAQPDCPLQLEKAERLARVGGGSGNNYRLRNKGTKPIRSFTVSYTFGEGTGGSRTWALKSQEIIAPGQLVPSSLQESDGEIIPLTDELRAKLGLQGALKTIVFYMVERVEFADGSVYSDEATAATLRSYLESTADLVGRASPHQ